MSGHDNPFEDESAFDDVNLAGAGDGFHSNAFTDPAVRSQLLQANLDLDDDDVFGSTEPTRDLSAGVSGTVGNVGVAAGTINSGLPSQERQTDAKKRETVGATGFCAIMKVEYYRTYFDVDTDDVLQRLKCVVMPWKANFFEVVDGKPDFYGPFWTCATLVFLIAVTANLAAWWRSDAEAEEPWQDFTVLSYGASLVFGFAVAMPFVAWACFTYLGVSTAKITFAELACVYGYSIFAFLFACVLSMVPIAAFQLAAVVLALGCSATFLLRNLWARLGASENGGYMPPMSTASGEDPEADPLVVEPPNRRVAGILLVGLLGLHVVFAMILKFQFFVSA